MIDSNFINRHSKRIYLLCIILTGIGITLNFSPVNILVFISHVIIYIGLQSFVITLIINRLEKIQPPKNRIGGIFLVPGLINLILNHDLLYNLTFILRDMNSNTQLLQILSCHIIWFTSEIFIVSLGIFLIASSTDKSKILLENISVKIGILCLFALFVLNLPLFYPHVNFAGHLHGHVFWDSLHFH